MGPVLPPLPLDRGIFLANGRCCLVLLIELLSPIRVWLPSYLCPSIIAAVCKTGVPFSFYEVDYDLRVSPGALSKVGKGDLVNIALRPEMLKGRHASSGRAGRQKRGNGAAESGSSSGRTGTLSEPVSD